MKNLLNYISDNYSPVGLIVYGSYADGSNNEHSDFDALVISRDQGMFHDASYVDGVQLDVFVYPASYFEGEYNCEDFIQTADGKIITDTDGSAAQLMDTVKTYLAALPRKSPAEVRSDIEWCKKMLHRTQRADAEGLFRRHWLITDSLEIYFNAMGLYYRGPKKALCQLQREQPEVFRIYSDVLEDKSGALDAWVDFLDKQF